MDERTGWERPGVEPFVSLLDGRDTGVRFMDGLPVA